MVMIAVVLVCWMLLSLPVAVLIGKGIARGLAPVEPPAAPSVPAQRSAPSGAARERAQSGLSHA